MKKKTAGLLCAGMLLTVPYTISPIMATTPVAHNTYHKPATRPLSTPTPPAVPGGVKGRIYDAQTQEALGYVNVKVCRKGTTYPLQGAVTDTLGNFHLGGINAGTYDLIISCVGYNTLTQEIRIQSASQMLDLKEILLKTDDEMLNEVQVRGQRSQMKFEIDKKVFNVGADLSSAGESASEVLSNIPSVEVDNEGEISLRGNSSVTIWINGKESGLTADNRAQILEQLPAETIERIEVVTNPSAKFSPEGTAGIINIILKEDRRAGYFGSVQAGGNTRGRANAGANINYSSPKLDANGSIGYRHFERDGGSLSRRMYEDDTYLNSDSENDGRGDHLFLRGGLTYRLTKKDEVNAMAFGMFGKGKNYTDLLYDATDYRSNRNTSSSDDMNGGHVSLGYKHTFRDEHYLDFTAAYSTWGMDGSSDFNQSYTSKNEEPADPREYQGQVNDIGSHDWTFQLDYNYKINDLYKIEAGYKGTLSREDSPIETMEGTTESDARPNYGLYNQFLYDQDVHALYATFSGKVQKFGYQVGLRGEYTRVETQSNTKDDQGIKHDGNPFNKDYFDLYPSAFLTYDLGRGNEIQVNYSRRISRPWGGQLNSFQNITDKTNISMGNPELMPQYSNSFELNYIKSWEKGHTVSVSGYYHTTEDVIQRVTYMERVDDLNVMYNTSVNIGKSQSAGLELVGKAKVTRWFDLTTTANLYYYKLDAFTYREQSYDAQEQFSWNARMIANLLLPAGISFQATGNYRSRMAIAQGTRKANYSVDMGLKKNFFDKKLALNLNVRDLFDSRRMKSSTSGTGFTQYSERWFGGRTFGITLTYNFGNMAPKRPMQQKSNAGGDSAGGMGGGYGDSMGEE